MYLNAAQFVLSMFLASSGLGQNAQEGGFVAADVGHTCSIGSEVAPNIAMNTMTGEQVLQGDLDAMNSLQFYTDPGGVLVTYLEIDSGTTVVLRDFDDWTIHAFHSEAGVLVDWTRASAGEAWFTFNVATITEYEVDVTATAGTTTPKKKKKIYIKVKPVSTL